MTKFRLGEIIVHASVFEHNEHGDVINRYQQEQKAAFGANGLRALADQLERAVADLNPNEPPNDEERPA